MKAIDRGTLFFETLTDYYRKILEGKSGDISPKMQIKLEKAEDALFDVIEEWMKEAK